MTPMSFCKYLSPYCKSCITFVHKLQAKSVSIFPAPTSAFKLQPFNMASNRDSKSAAASTDSAPRQEKTDDALQFDDATTFSADPVPKSGAFVSAASDSDEDGDAYKKNPFLDPDVAEHWTTIYEKSEYECRHFFDPSLTWTEEEEKKIVRRLDWRVCLWAVSRPRNASFYSTHSNVLQCVMFFGLQVDRGNLVQALADNLLNDLHLSTNRT